jgi:hypothetical protein
MGSWHLVGDGIALAPLDMRFDVLWRSGGTDRMVVSFQHHFDPTKDSSAARFDADASGQAVAAKAGDLLVLRMTANSSIAGAAYIPNADGEHANGRIPSITLP